MGKVYLDMAMSLDGFISGAKGEDKGLHDWYFSPSGDAEFVKSELLETIGAMILGKRAFSSSPEDVCVAGGANTAQQFINAGLLDELQIHLVPVLIGQGLRLFDALEGAGFKLEKTRMLESSGVTHLRYRMIK